MTRDYLACGLSHKESLEPILKIAHVSTEQKGDILRWDSSREPPAIRSSSRLDFRIFGKIEAWEIFKMGSTLRTNTDVIVRAVQLLRT